MTILSYTAELNDNQVALCCSEGEPLLTDKWEEVITYLMMPADMCLVYGLDEFVRIISTTFPKDRQKELFNGDKARVYLPMGEKLFYIPQRQFSITYAGREVNFYGLSKYQDKEPTTVKELLELGNKVIAAYKEFGIVPTHLKSPVSVYSDCLDRLKFPRAKDLPEQALPMVNEASKIMLREWREVHKLGYWKMGETTDLDLQCYSDDTEALTINGWKLIKDLAIGEMILAFKPDTNRCSFQPVKHLNNTSYSGDMYYLESRNASLLVTPNHRVLFKSKIRSKNQKEFIKTGRSVYSGWLNKEVSSVPNGNICLPISYPIEERPDYKISDNYIRLLAWINTEGYTEKSPKGIGGVYHTFIGIEQSLDRNSLYCEEINQILHSLGIPYKIRTRTHYYKHEYPIVKDCIMVERNIPQKSNIFRIPTKDARNIPLDKDNIHFIPLWMLEKLSVRQLEVYFDALMKGDGNIFCRQDNITRAAFTTKYKINTDRFQYLCHLIGYKTSFKKHKNRETYSIAVNINRRQVNHLNNDSGLNFRSGFQIVKYNGKVVCPTVDSGYIVVRRNGKSCICGNSGYPSLIANLPDISKAKFFESDTLPERYSWGILNGGLETQRAVSPFQDDNGIHWFGLKEDYTFTTDGLWLITKYGGNFKMKHGWFFLLPETYSYPFRATMQKLYHKRESPNPIVGKTAKGISVGIYGMLAQRYLQPDQSWKLGDNFNSIYALMTTSRCGLKVADCIYKHGLDDRVINITVDGFLAEGKVEIPQVKEMGKWRVEKPSEALVMSQLNAWHGDKHPNGKYVAEMVEWLQKEPKQSVYGDLDLNLFEHTRNFPKRPKNGGELISNKYSSEPLLKPSE